MYSVNHQRTLEWPFAMSAYYADNVRHPKVPGKLAIATRHRGEHSLYMDVIAANSRDDIGHVSWSGPVSNHTLRLLQSLSKT